MEWSEIRQARRAEMALTKRHLFWLCGRIRARQTPRFVVYDEAGGKGKKRKKHDALKTFDEC